MIIDIWHNIDQLEFKIVDQWFTVETTDSYICILFAPTKHMCEINNNGNLGIVGIKGIIPEDGGRYWS
jgi:hypothetical protein